MAIDLSFNNSQIKAYFEGSDSYVPSSELLYIHTHPLVRPNFLTDLEVLIVNATEEMVAKNIRGAIVDKFTQLAISLGTLLPELSNMDDAKAKEAAVKMMPTLRELYQLAMKFQSTGRH